VSSFAVFYPDRVRSLWLLAPGGVATAEESDVRRVYRETGELMLVAESPEDFGRVLDVVFAKPPFIPSPIRRVLAEQAAANQPLHARIFTELGEEAFWLEPQLAGNPVPALIVWGEKDRVLHVSGAQVFKSLLPNGQVQILNGIGHLPMLEAPETVAEAYLTFRSTL
jgi:abhydrolase domain-containing protein 6